MRRTFYAWILLFAAPWVHAASLEDYGRLPAIEDMALSPGGTRIAYVRTDGEQRFVVIESLDSKDKPTLIKYGEAKLRGISWADEDHLMIEDSVAEQPSFLRGGLQEWQMLNLFDLKSHRMRSIPEISMGAGVRTMNTIIGEPQVRTINGRTSIFVTGIRFEGAQGVPALFCSDLGATSDIILREGTAQTRRWFVDENGNVGAEENYSDTTGHWVISGSTNGQTLRQLADGHAAIEYPELVGYGPEPNSLMISSLEDGNQTLRLLHLDTGKLDEAVSRDGLGGPIVDRRSLRATGLRFVDADKPYLFFDANRQQSWLAIEQAFKGERPVIVSASDDFSRVIVRVQGQPHGYSFQLIDLQKRQAVPLGPVYRGVTALLPKQSIQYAATDGLQIQAWLTLPADRPSKGLPLIVMPHGGPAARDGYEFDWWSQALAGQGYAVLQPNYRGSDYGWKLMSAGFGEFGRKMQTDLSDGVAYLAQQGTIDRSRVCILGDSYGGYAALAAATLQPDIYRCAVSVSGIADLKTFTRNIEGFQASDQTSQTMRYWDRYLGTKGADDPTIAAISPIEHVDAVKIPILLVHGKDDSVVPIDQSRSMLKALQGAHKDAQLVELDGEDHWLSRSKTRLQMLQVTTAFLIAHNPPDAPATASTAAAMH